MNKLTSLATGLTLAIASLGAFMLNTPRWPRRPGT